MKKREIPSGAFVVIDGKIDKSPNAFNKFLRLLEKENEKRGCSTEQLFEHEYGSYIKAKAGENDASRPKPVFKAQPPN